MSEIFKESEGVAADHLQDLDLLQARKGDDTAFNRLVKPLHGELYAHCYRMLGSSHDADDALQDGLLRAWRGIDGFEGRGSLRSWLYTVVTRTCLDLVEARGRRALPMDLRPSSESTVIDDIQLHDIAWLGPFSDINLADGPVSPDAVYERRESVELAFVSALQHLPGNQRAALLLFEVLGFSAAEIAEIMDTSTASVNSALQRARQVVSERVPAATQQQTLRKIDSGRLQGIVAEYVRAFEHSDTDALIALLTEDVTWTMPPFPHWYQGTKAVTDFVLKLPMTDCGLWQHMTTSANGQLAVACYLQPRGSDSDEYVAWSIDVLTFRDEKISAITAFVGAEHMTTLGLPASLNPPGE